MAHTGDAISKKKEVVAMEMVAEQSLQLSKAEEVRKNASGLASVKKSEIDFAGGAGVAQQKNVIHITGYTPAQPNKGQENFDKYIEENIRKPAVATSGQMEVVALSFIVKSIGKLDSIKIISSPGKTFSDEAIRLIKEGPEWKPAEQNNIKIDDEVRIRIIFK
jgi:outer membrane biosynthesis protein TonB